MSPELVMEIIQELQKNGLISVNKTPDEVKKAIDAALEKLLPGYDDKDW